MSNKQEQPQSFASSVWEITRVVAGALVIASFVRTIWVEPFKIPSSSMVPTLLIGDYLFVNKFHYGFRNPCSGERIMKEPIKRGDVVVFAKKKGYACGTLLGAGSLNFIKRVVAVPGDKVAYTADKRLIINGNEAKLTNNGVYKYKDSNGKILTADLFEEDLGGIKHAAMTMTIREGRAVRETTVPAGKYVVVGDNRDNSIDSRFWVEPFWGFVDEKDIVGRAEMIFWSWDQDLKPRFERPFTSLRADKISAPEATNADSNQASAAAPMFVKSNLATASMQVAEK